MLQISSPQVTPGFSGAPVMDEVNRRVVGMVTSIARPDTYGRMAETAFVTPTETLRMVCPELQLKDVQPYLGLAAFSESDAEFFFGRKREVERLVESLRREPRFLAVLGPSGSGKSSVIQAGLIPDMRRARGPGSDRWGIITARPGDRPLENLEAKVLIGASSGLVDAAASWLAKNPDKIRLMLILDQFEELFAVASLEVQKDFLIQLEGLLQSDLPITLMLVMRDDFFSRFAKEAPPGLFEWVQRGFVHISSALDEGELREIIQGPAKKVGLQFEAGLEEAIVKDVLETTANGERAGRSTVLPLLEFALTQLWERRSDGFLTHEAYSKIGGVTGSLTLWADQAYQSLAKDGLGEMARRVLTELVNPGDERQNLPDSRWRRSLQVICAQENQKEAVHRVVHRLADARLVTTSFDEQSKQETVEIIHDSLIREWARLRQWLQEDRSFLAWKREIEKKTDAWAEGKRDEGRLVRGLDLSEAQRWQEQRSNEIGKEEQEYIQASLALQERERAEKEKNRRRWMKGLTAFSAIALILSVMAVFEWNQADQKTEEALALYLASQSEQIKAVSGSDYARQVLLAVESLRHKETADGDLALRNSMALLVRPLAQLNHNSQVFAVAFSPDGTKVLTGSSDYTARIWDASNGQEVHKLNHDGMVYAVAFSPDGTKVLTGSSDNTARIWDVTNGQELHKLNHDGTVYAVAFSPDGTKVLTGSRDNTARIWDVSTGQELHKLNHDGTVFAVAFSPDGTKVLTGSYDYTARIWDVATGQELHKLTHEDLVRAVAFSPDGTKVLTGSDDKTARIWDVATGQELYKLNHDGTVFAVAFSPDGTKVLTGSDDKTARMWDVATGQELHKLNHDGWVYAVAFSPDGTKVLTGSYDKTARIWDVSTGQEVHKLNHDGTVFAVAFSPDGTKVLTGSLNGIARIWDVSTGQELHKLNHDGTVFAVAFSPDGTKVLTGSYDYTARIWDVSTGQELHKLNHDGLVFAVAFSPDGTKVLTGSRDNTARIWDVSTGQELHKLTHDGRVNAVAFSPDGTKVLTGSRDKTARIWDVSSGKELHKLNHDYPVFAVAFSPDGTNVLTGSDDKTARIWDVTTGQELHKLNHDGMVNAVAFSPNGTKVLTVCSDNTARIWEVSSGKELHKLTHNGPVNAVAFSPDGTEVLTGSGDNTARVWEVSSGKELHTLTHNGPVNAVAFSPNGTKVLTGSSDKTAWIWPVSDRDLIEQACSCLPENLSIEQWGQYSISDVKTCPKEGRFNQSVLNRFLNDPKGFLTGSDECQPCIAEAFRNRK